MIKLRYTIVSYIDDPKPWDFFKILGEIYIDDRCFFVVLDTIQNTAIIREFFKIKETKFENGNLLAAIEDDFLHEQLLSIAKKEGIVR
jgi:hypothetical protein